MSKPQIFDVLIVGGGPSGLSAATGLARLLHSVLVFDSGVYRNARSSHMHVVPTWDHQDPKDFRAAARKDILARYNTTKFQDVKVESISRTDSGLFRARDATKAEWLGKKVILATGVRDLYPDIEGYSECWAYGIFHCLFCHGYESRGGPSAGVLALGATADVARAIHVAHNAAQLASTVTIYTFANPALTTAMRAAAAKKPHKFAVDDRNVIKMAKSPQGSDVVLYFADGTQKTEAFLVHHPATEVNGPFAKQLGCEMTETGDIRTANFFGGTTVPGVFAIGDCATVVKAVISAMNLGAMAAAGVAAELEVEMD